MASGGNLTLRWDDDNPSASVTITDRDGGTPVFTVAGSPVTFPYTLTGDTKFTTANDGRYQLSVTCQGVEIAADPDGSYDFDLAGGKGEIRTVDFDKSTGSLMSALSATYVAPSRIAPAATGVAATDTANLQAAIDDTPRGGFLYIPTGTYHINAALTLSDHITIGGAGLTEIMGTVIAGNTTALNTPPDAPYFAGTVIMQTAAATDAFALSAGGLVVNIRNLGVRFDPAIHFQNTGHGFNMMGPVSGSGGHDSGIVWSRWENVAVFGHDGDHYAFRFINPMNDTLTHLRSYGGGGFKFECDSYHGNYGNSTVNHPYAALFAGGTADAFRFTSRQNGSTGRLNFIGLIRPQGIGLSMGPVRFGADPVVNTQSLFYVDDNTPHIHLTAGDFETAISGQAIRLPTSLPIFFDPASTFPQPATPIALVRGYDGNRAIFSDMSVGRYTSQALSNKFTKAGLGTAPPAITEVKQSDDWRGLLGFGTGTAPAAGELVDIRFNKNRGDSMIPTITPMNAATAALGLYVSTNTAVGFVVSCQNAPAASQPAGTYQFAYTMTR